MTNNWYGGRTKAGFAKFRGSESNKGAMSPFESIHVHVRYKRAK